jgi:hypothetical protein
MISTTKILYPRIEAFGFASGLAGTIVFQNANAKDGDNELLQLRSHPDWSAGR